MKIDKTFTIAATQDKVWQFISAPEKVGMCFPGCEEVTALGEDKYKAIIKVQIGPIKTVFNIDFEETEKRPPEYSAYTSRGEEGNRASRLKAESTLTLSSLEESRTQVVYTSDLSIVGRLGKFGLGMMKKKADAMGDEFIQILRTEIEGPKVTTEEAPATTEPPPVATGRKIVVAIIAVTLAYLVFYYLTR